MHEADSTHPPRKHYERVIAACAFVFIFVNIGMPSTSFSVFQPYIVDEVGHTGGALILFTRALASLAAMFIVDRFLIRFDIRKGVGMASAMTAVGFVIYAVAPNLPVYLVGAVFAGLGYGLGGMVAITILLNRWFKDRVSTAVGFAAAGSGVASILLPLLALHIITYYSLSFALLAEAIIAGLAAAITTMLLRNQPSDIGAQPYRSDTTDAQKKKGKAHREHGPGINPSAPMRRALIASMFLLGAIAFGGTAYLTILMTSEGFDPVFAGFLFAGMGAALTVSKFAAGELFDHVGTKRGSEILYLVLILSLALSCLMPLGSPIIAGATAFTYGVGISLATTGISVWSLELTDSLHVHKNVKNFQLAYAAGGVLFNIAPGILMELTGTYVVSYAIMLVFAIISGWIVRAGYKSVGRA